MDVEFPLSLVHAEPGFENDALPQKEKPALP
jgi:hypothetical protein